MRPFRSEFIRIWRPAFFKQTVNGCVQMNCVFFGAQAEGIRLTSSFIKPAFAVTIPVNHFGILA